MVSDIAPLTVYPWTANIDKKLKVNKLNVTLYEREYFRNSSFTLQSIRIISINSSNKSCSELNFPQKTQRTHISISSRSRVRGFQIFPFSISYNVLKLQNYQNHDNSGMLRLTSSYFNFFMISSEINKNLIS